MCPAPIGSPKKPPSRDWVPGLEQALPGHQEQLPQWAPALAVLASLAPSLMTGQWQATRPRTQRGLRSAPTSCGGEGSACRGAGRGGSRGDPPPAGKKQERGGAREECAEAPVYPGAERHPQPFPCLLPPQVAESSGATTPGGRGRSWGGAQVRISVEPRDRPGRCRFVTHRPTHTNSQAP